MAFFCTMGGSGFEKLFAEMEKISDVKPLATLAITSAEVQSNTYKNDLEKFIEKLTKETL